MPTITKLKATSKGRKVKLFVDGQLFTEISPHTVYQQSLKKGQDLSTSDLNDLKYQSEVKKATAKALNLLSYRPRSCFEIKTRLRRKKFPNPVIKRALSKLKEQDYLNDQSFASWFVDQRLSHKPKGPIALRSELFKKGIDRQVIDQVLTEKIEGPDHLKKLAAQALQKKQSLRNLPPKEAKRKLLSYLSRRGFSYRSSKPVVDEFLSAE